MNDNIDAASACQRYNESATPGLKVEFERRFMERFGATPRHAVPPEEVKRIWDELFMGHALDLAVPDLTSAIRTVCEVISEDDDEVGFKVYMPFWKIAERQTQFVNAMKVFRNYVGMQTEPKIG